MRIKIVTPEGENILRTLYQDEKIIELSEVLKINLIDYLLFPLVVKVTKIYIYINSTYEIKVQNKKKENKSNKMTKGN